MVIDGLINDMTGFAFWYCHYMLINVSRRKRDEELCVYILTLHVKTVLVSGIKLVGSLSKLITQDLTFRSK